MTASRDLTGDSPALLLSLLPSRSSTPTPSTRGFSTDMPALFARSNAKRQRLLKEVNLAERADDGFWTPRMGESTAAPVRIINPKHTAIVAEPTALTIESPTVALTPSVAVVTVTSIVYEAAPTPAPSTTLTDEDDLFGVASSSAIKIVDISDDATSSSAVETETVSPSTTDASAPAPTASATTSESSSEAVSRTESPLVSASTTEGSATETDELFGLPSQSQIALVSTSSESLESLPSTAFAATPTVENASQAVSLPSSAASSSEAIFSLGSTRIAVVSSSSNFLSAASSSAIASIIDLSSSPSLATSLPSSASSTSSSSEKLFSLAPSRIAAVSTRAEASSSLAAASSSSRLSASSTSAAASRSAAATQHNGASSTSSSSWSTSTTASTSEDIAASSGQTSTEQFFRSIGRSPISITITALVSTAILAIIIGIVAFFVRRCTRRRRRTTGHRQLGSEGGSPRLGAGAWGEKDMEEKGDDSDDGTDESDVHPEALWRRRVDRMNALASQRFPSPAPAAPLTRTRAQVAVAPEMSPISEQMSSSDWTSFIGDGDWGESADGRSRIGSIDSNADPTILASFSTKGLDPNDRNPHPLRHSWVPSFDSFDSPSLRSLGSPSSQYSPDDEESLVAGLPPTPRSRNFSGTEPPSPSTTEAPHSPSKTNLQQSLDRLVGSAAEYLGGFFSDDGHSKVDDVDRYTTFRGPRKAPPTPIIIPPTPRTLSAPSPPSISGPTFPERAATYTAVAPEGTSRPATSRGTNLSFLERSYSDGAQFLGVAHGHVARNLMGKLAVAAGREKPLYSSSKGLTSWSMDEEQAAKQACEQDSLLGGAGSSTVLHPQAEESIDPFDDSHAAPTPQTPPSSAPRAEAPPPSAASQPLIAFLSPFGQPRSMNFPNADEDKGNWSDETTSTIKRPLSMGSTIRPSPRKERPLAATLVARRFSTNSASSSSSSSSEHHADDNSNPTSSQLQRSFSDSQIAASSAAARPRPVSMASTGTFGSRDSEEDDLTSTESGGSDESDSSRAKRERMSRIEEQERTRRLMSERRRRSSGEIIKRV